MVPKYPRSANSNLWKRIKFHLGMLPGPGYACSRYLFTWPTRGPSSADNSQYCAMCGLPQNIDRVGASTCHATWSRAAQSHAKSITSSAQSSWSIASWRFSLVMLWHMHGSLRNHGGFKLLPTKRKWLCLSLLHWFITNVGHGILTLRGLQCGHAATRSVDSCVHVYMYLFISKERLYLCHSS